MEVDALEGRRARELAAYLLAEHSFCLKLIECRRKGDLEILLVEIDVEIAPRRPVPIARTEPLLLLCPKEGADIPYVVPARENFPIDQLHVTIHDDIDFASLCLWALPAEDLRARFTPFMFLARIKEWLELAAEGALHQPGQEEPVLTGMRAQAILPAGPIGPETLLMARGHEGPRHSLTIRFSEATPEDLEDHEGGFRFVLIPVTTDVVRGRAVRSAPRTLDQLAALLAEHGCDLGQTLTDFAVSSKDEAGLDAALPVILVTFPKSAAPDGLAEGEDRWGFWMDKTVGQLGEALGTFGVSDGHIVPIIATGEDRQDLKEIRLEPMVVVHELQGSQLSALSGMAGGDDLKCLAIGAGALGSKVLEICVRGGFGRWRVLDKDVYLPHNAVRHILGDWAVGQPKAPHLHHFLNQTVPGDRIEASYVADVIDPVGLPEDVTKAFTESDMIVDMSASVAVARTLALMEDIPRCVSLFFNPGASDVVMLQEDGGRTVSLLDLEASYYGALISDEALASHLHDPNVEAIRYANGCRDITARIGPDRVAILGGLAVQGLRQTLASPAPMAKMWRTGLDGSVNVTDLPVHTYRGALQGGWDVRWSEAVLETLRSQRQADLPNETGGILLGVVDFERGLIRVSAAIEAPPDSVKKPHYFERGRTGLERRLNEVVDMTAGQLRYIGEWHSHPRGIPARPSTDDDVLFATLAGLFKSTGEPHVMAIVGDAEMYWRLGFNNESADSILALLG